ncbi:MAG: hypothetical protein ACK52N_12130, partial [Lysobacteraceae bacterium]
TPASSMWKELAKTQIGWPCWIAGHEDLDTARVPASDDPSATVWRKRDPGPMFPWARVLADCGLARLVPEPGPATHHGE